MLRGVPGTTPGGRADTAGVTEAADEPAGLRRGLALLIAGAFFMEILDGTVIAPAAPLIGRASCRERV